MGKNKNFTHTEEKSYGARKQEWDEIEELVMEYKKQFNKDATSEDKIKSDDAAAELLERFEPLISKYANVIITGQINFNNNEIKAFVSAFIGDKYLRRALKSRRHSTDVRSRVYDDFNFVVATYGQLSNKEVKEDLRLLLLNLANRYKVMGRSFCGYVATTFKYEVIRHIKKFLSNPINIHYRNKEYEDAVKNEYANQFVSEVEMVDKYYENNIGLPDFSWIQGLSCSHMFSGLDVLDRKILIKYYLEDFNDREIAKEVGISTNAINKIRRDAVKSVAHRLGLDESDIKRNRKLSNSFTKDNKDLLEE